MMNKSILISLAAATLLTTSLNADSMYDRFHNMELEMQQLKEELATLKAKDTSSDEEESESQETEELSEDEEADEEESEDDAEEEEETEESDEDEEEEEMNIEEEIEDIHETLSDINKATSGNHLKLGVDYRFAVDNMQYKMADGSKASNDAFMTNRFWLNMNWSATENLSFTGQMAYNKAFGARSGAEMAPYETFDWIANENAYDDTLRIRSAYFLYRNDTFFESEIPWTFSIGRRPATNGHLVSLRDDDKEASPMGHTINVEFDGLSSKFSFSNWVDGMYLKICAGRGMSNAAPKFSTSPYAEVENGTANPNIDLIGFIFSPYNNGQYSLSTQYYYASNLIDAVDAMDPSQGMQTVGGMHSFTANIALNGIGNEINDYLDDSVFFISGAVSATDPKNSQRMLYSEFNMDGTQNEAGESKTGYSAWVGLQMPSFMTEEGRWGLEYNYGSQYWRSITYGEDTNIGSKLAARGSAYEAYFTEYLVEDILSLQVRYTYVDYDYSGSNGFFGSSTGAAIQISDIASAPMASQVVDTAQDIRFYLRYKY